MFFTFKKEYGNSGGGGGGKKKYIGIWRPKYNTVGTKIVKSSPGLTT